MKDRSTEYMSGQLKVWRFLVLGVFVTVIMYLSRPFEINPTNKTVDVYELVDWYRTVRIVYQNSIYLIDLLKQLENSNSRKKLL